MHEKAGLIDASAQAGSMGGCQFLNLKPLNSWQCGIFNEEKKNLNRIIKKPQKGSQILNSSLLPQKAGKGRTQIRFLRKIKNTKTNPPRAGFRHWRRMCSRQDPFWASCNPAGYRTLRHTGEIQKTDGVLSSNGSLAQGGSAGMVEAWGRWS